jgi:S-(hydroxymethyl)glutathione dehydrogenase/alcohol dehydrogenase
MDEDGGEAGMKVKAAVCYEYGKPLVIEEVEMDPVEKGEVKVRIAAAAICHSDIHSVKGEHGRGKLPALVGHEVAGYVEEVGEGVTYVRPGDHVVCCIMRAGCGHCHYCILGYPNYCENWHFEFQRPGPYRTGKGEQLMLFGGLYAGFLEYTKLPEDGVVKLPEDMPLDRAALIGCGVISGFGAVFNRAKVAPFDSVAVMGAGGVGLNAIQGAAFVGAHPIIALDVVDSKLEAARSFGATHAVNVKTQVDPIALVKKITHGRGVDHMFITVAGIGPKRQGFMMLSPRGKEIVIGHGTGEMMSQWDVVEFMGGKSMTGSAMGACRIRVDIPRIVELYQAGRYKLDELISKKFSLDQINEARADAEEGESLRNVIMF